jgi:DNA-binding FadR family transcriptional regulator
VYRDEKDIPARRSRSDAAHQKLVELVEAGETAAAEAHWRAHLDDLGVRMGKTSALKRRVDLFS